MVPAARGIGLAVVVTMLINSVLNGVTVAYALYYLIFVIQSVSNCQLPAFVSRDLLQNLLQVVVSIRRSNGTKEAYLSF